jgi:hypothetical protein
MARRARQPLFRLALYPFVDSWPAGPTLSFPVVRFALIASFAADGAPAGGPQGPFHLQPALLTPELPYSLLPPALAAAVNLTLPNAPPAEWQGQPMPLWRGVPCRIGHVRLRVINDVTGQPLDLRLLVLVPDRDPPGPRTNHALLGAEFLTHYGLRASLDYQAISYVPHPTTGQRQIDVSVVAGHLEAW